MSDFNSHVRRLIQEHFLIVEAEKKLALRKTRLQEDIDNLPVDVRASYQASIERIQAR